jgi:hypothetical protein
MPLIGKDAAQPWAGKIDAAVTSASALLDVRAAPQWLTSDSLRILDGVTGLAGENRQRQRAVRRPVRLPLRPQDP